jgi:hypothetical protein
MSATAREVVLRTLNFDRPPRVARDLWVLPVAADRHPAELAALRRDYPSDFVHLIGHVRQPPPTRGDPYAVGKYTDEWGCTFVNLQPGVIGEVKQPLVTDWIADRARVNFPGGWLTLDRDSVNRAAAATDLFTAPSVCPRPFERLQFLRGSENLYLDLADPPPGFTDFVRDLHAFYCEVLTGWARTDVDCLLFMDDWGSQRGPLISPALWRDLFMPLYRDFVQIAHGHGKKILMHSDGHIVALFPDLIEIGVDAVNSQIFCMGVDALQPFAGRITFWGEIDRQRLLPFATTDEVDQAVRKVHAALWRDGGCIAQCEFGPAARPENIRQVFATWDSLVP